MAKAEHPTPNTQQPEKPQDSSNNGTVSAATISELTGYTDRRNRQIGDLGYFDPPVRGRYYLKKTIQGVIRYLKEARSAGKDAEAAERVRKLRESADEIALRNAKGRNELVDKADFLKRLEPIYTEARQKVLASSMRDSEKDALLGALSKVHDL